MNRPKYWIATRRDAKFKRAHTCLYTYVGTSIVGHLVTEGKRERGGAAAGASAAPAGAGPAPLPSPALLPAPAHCQVQCQGHARASAAARRNAGAAGGGRRPASRQCLTDDRDTRRLANFPHSRCNGSPDKHFRNIVDNSEVTRVSACISTVCGLASVVLRRVGIPVNTSCAFPTTPRVTLSVGPAGPAQRRPCLLCNNPINILRYNCEDEKGLHFRWPPRQIRQ